MKITPQLLGLMLLAAAVSCNSRPSGPYAFEDIPFSVIPCPASVSLAEGFFELTGADFYVDEKLGQDGQDVARDFSARLQQVSGYRNPFKAGQPESGVRFLYGEVPGSAEA